MIELFYPSDLKRLIRILQEKGELNTGALERMNSYIIKRACIISFISIFFIIIGILFSKTFITSAILIAVALVLIFAVLFEIHRLLYISILYSSGDSCNGIIKKVVKSNKLSTNRCWFIEYEFGVGDKVFSLRTPNLPIFFLDKDYNFSEEITVFYNPRNPNHSVPATNKLYTTLNLKKP